jgi:predicted SprT family Zn-dependent metalloprotease
MDATELAMELGELPPELTPLHAELARAVEDVLDPKAWDEDSKIVRAHAPEAIAKLLITVFHRHLRGRPMAYLWQQSMERNGKITLGKATKAGGKVRFFGDVEFVIDFNWTWWRKLSARERIALVDHELTHCDAVEGVPTMKPHDVEEFSEIVRKWGLWQPDLEHFGEAVREAQMSLFAGASTK